jgi:hypothetical protein
MYEINPNNKQLISNSSHSDPYSLFIPSHMRNFNDLLRIGQKLNKITWEKEGNFVKNFLYNI